jgi:hypothetical protein
LSSLGWLSEEGLLDSSRPVTRDRDLSVQRFEARDLLLNSIDDVAGQVRFSTVAANLRGNVSDREDPISAHERDGGLSGRERAATERAGSGASGVV